MESRYGVILSLGWGDVNDKWYIERVGALNYLLVLKVFSCLRLYWLKPCHFGVDFLLNSMEWFLVSISCVDSLFSLRYYAVKLRTRFFDKVF